MKKIFLTACFVLQTLVAAAEVPAGISVAIDYTRRFTYAEPTEHVHSLAHYIARISADAIARRELAQALLWAITADGTTPQGRTIICQQLALVAADAERESLRALLEKPDLAEDVKIAGRCVLNDAAGQTPPSREECLADIADTNRARRVAGAASLARFYPADARPELLNRVMDDDDAVAFTAIRALARLDAEALTNALSKLAPNRQAVALGALEDGKVKKALPAIQALLGSKDEKVQLAAISALAVVGDAQVIDDLLKMVGDEPATALAILYTLSVLPDPKADRQILQLIRKGKPAQADVLMHAAARRGTPGLEEILLKQMTAADRRVSGAALDLLGDIGSYGAYTQVVSLLVSAPLLDVESAAKTMARRLADPVSAIQTLTAALQCARKNPQVTAALLRLLVATDADAGIDAVAPYLSHANTNLVDAAVRALVKARSLHALAALDRVTGDAFTPVQRTLALSAQLQLCQKAPDAAAWLARLQPRTTSVEEERLFLSAAAAVTNADVRAVVNAYKDRKDLRMEYESVMDAIRQQLPVRVVRREELAKQYAKKGAVVAYLDCGAAESDETGPVRIRAMRGNPFAWGGDLAQKHRAAGTVIFDSGQIDFRIDRLQTGHQYSVGFTWWDLDQRGRKMSFWMDDQRFVESVPLPAGEAGPATIDVPVPESVVADGFVSAVFRSEVPVNAVVGEIWVVDTGAIPAPEVRANPGAAKKVLIVTGLDYPGHLWRQTTPVLVNALKQDPRLEISVTEDPAFLGSPKLAGYNAVVLHYMNWKDPGPGPAAQENLRLCLVRGTGLVLVHFACGAFQGWKEFAKMAGRVWDPKVRGHDPRGPFQVNIVDANHPIMTGMSDFRTDDELYTCLVGDTPIHLLAAAVSKVDQKKYPMAFTLEYGLGRVFHSTLGHDVKAFDGEVGRLYRRGAAWAAGLSPE